MQKYVKGSSIHSKLFCCEIAKGSASGILLLVTFPRAGKGRVPDPRRTIPGECERHDRR